MSKRIEPAPGVLYVVGTPIGNLGDLSPRAQSLLKNVSIIACEDTRHSGQMLRHVGATAPLLSFYEHNTNTRLPQLIDFLSQGKSLALISDAGLPGISDPGEKLVSAARNEGHEVICIPGPCAAITALVASGIPSHRFCFEGFLPAKSNERKKFLSLVAKETRTTILYEAPHRLIQLLEELSVFCGEDRPLHISRELTKRHEQHIGATIGEALEYFLINKPIGEFTLVLGGALEEINPQKNKEELIAEMKDLVRNGSSRSEAAKKLALRHGESRRLLYALVHKIDFDGGN